MSVQINLTVTIKDEETWSVNARYALDEIGLLIESAGKDLPSTDHGEATYFTYAYTANGDKE